MCSLIGFSQSSIKQLQQTARDYNNRGDHANAVIVLRQGLRDFPKALELEKDLILSLTLQREFASAKELAVALTQRADADVVNLLGRWHTSRSIVWRQLLQCCLALFKN